MKKRFPLRFYFMRARIFGYLLALILVVVVLYIAYKTITD